MKMESEKIISFEEIVDFSEDEEPPSGCESKVNTFAFDCVDEQYFSSPPINLPTGKCSSRFILKKSHRKDLKLLSSWRLPIRNSITSVDQQKSTLRHFEQITMLVTTLQLFALWLTP